MHNTSNMTATFSGDDDYGDYDNYNYSYGSTNNTTDGYDYDNSDWCDPDEHKDTIKIFQTCMFCLIFLLGVTGNCLVIATFALYRRLRLRSMTDIFLFHLALADLLLLLTLPLQAVDTNKGWIFSATLCGATRACYAINTYSGLLLLACISVDRYLVVARAQQMLRLRCRILLAGKVAAVGVWLVAVLLSLPEILFSGVTGSGKDAWCGMSGSRTAKMAANGAIIAVFCLSFFVMVVCYSSIGLVLCEGNAHGRGKQWHRQRTLKLMVALVLVFVVFQLPYTVVLSLKMAGPICALLLQYITCTMAYARCCLNPILYALVGVRFRGDVQRLLHDWGCARGAQPVSHTVSSIMASTHSPPSHERSYSSNEAVSPIKIQFLGKN